MAGREWSRVQLKPLMICLLYTRTDELPGLRLRRFGLGAMCTPIGGTEEERQRTIRQNTISDETNGATWVPCCWPTQIPPAQSKEMANRLSYDAMKGATVLTRWNETLEKTLRRAKASQKPLDRNICEAKNQAGDRFDRVSTRVELQAVAARCMSVVESVMRAVECKKMLATRWLLLALSLSAFNTPYCVSVRWDALRSSAHARSDTLSILR